MRRRFKQKYGIPVQITRLPGTTLQTRLSAEETAGTHTGDLVMLSDDPCGFHAAHPTWIENFGVKAIPLWPSYTKSAKQYVWKCDDGWSYPVIGIKPWGIIYNTDKVKSPPTWADLASPAFAKHFALPDVRVADAYYDFWSLMLKTYGANFLTQIANNSKLINGGSAAAQSVAAGEQWATAPTHIGVFASTSANGRAPIALTIPSPTVGLETTAFLLARNLQPHPNAAALFVNYLLSGAGNLQLAGGGGKDSADGYSIYHLDYLPKNYDAPDHDAAAAAKTQINSLFGLK